MTALLVIGSILGLLAVALGAFGAHALQRRLTPERLTVYRTGVQYQMIHTLAILAAVLLRRAGLASPLGIAAGWLWVAGVALFSGSLYALTATEARRLGAVTPVGGLCLVAGWALLAAGVAAR